MVICIFTYNRTVYLKNLVRSYFQYYSSYDLVILDDNSNSMGHLDYLKSLEAEESITVIYSQTQKVLRHGGLYYNMNKALDYALEKNYRYAFFIQDDMQFIWKNEGLLRELDESFKKHTNALMISPIFLQKMYKWSLNDNIEICKSGTFFKDRGVADIGVIHLGRAKEATLFFDDNGESYNGKTFYKKGYSLLISKKPVLAWVPYSSFYRKRTFSSFKNIYNNKTPIIKPLSEEQLAKIKNSNSILYCEDFCSLQLWWIPKPYIYLENNLWGILKKLAKYYLKRP